MLTETISAEQRAERLKQIIDTAIERLATQLKAGHTQEYLALLTFWSRFHRYSHGNVLLILAQRPDATQVAGYRTWQRLGRQVGEGAKAIQIWCPITRMQPDPETGLPVEMLVGFSACPVFAAEDLVDIASHPLPTLWKPLPDDIEERYRYLKGMIEAHGFQVEEQRLPSSRQGMTSPDGTITVAKGLDSRNRTMVLLHELAHAIEHLRPERQESAREIKELEAESAAAIVCAILGIDHPTARDYILMYAGDADGLKTSLVTIRRIVDRMVTLLALIQPPREQARPAAAD